MIAFAITTEFTLPMTLPTHANILDGLPAYFDYETEFCFSWVPDKKKAHVFATFDDAFVFAKRTEAAHAERIRDGKAAASNVVILPVN